MELLACDFPEITVRIVCSKGTYIRAIARDLGEALGSGAHLTGLRRTRVGGIKIDDCMTVEEAIEKNIHRRIDFPGRLPDAGARLRRGRKRFVCNSKHIKN